MMSQCCDKYNRERGIVMRWSQDNFVFVILSRVFDVCCLSLLWIICSLPIVTIGASTTALHAAMQKICRDETSSMLKTFFGAFKSNFKQSTKIWLLMVLFFIVMAGDFYAFITIEAIPAAFQVVPFFCSLVFILMSFWVFSYQARFEGKMSAVLKNAILMSMRHLGWTLLILLIFLICALLGASVAILLIFVPGIYAYIKAVIQRKVFDRYETE